MNMEQQTNNRNGKPQPGRPNMPRFSLNWLYMIVLIMIAALWFTNDGSGASREVAYNEFQQYVRNGYVQKVIGYDDSSVEAYI